jgi:hypothetical protein
MDETLRDAHLLFHAFGRMRDTQVAMFCKGDGIEARSNLRV